MPTRSLPNRPALSLLAIGTLAAGALPGTPLLAQLPDDPVGGLSPKKLCFEGRRAQFCERFAVTEFGYARSMGRDRPERFGANHVEPHVVLWELGLMQNTDARTALGGTVLLTSRFSLGVKARYRRWLWRDISLEVSPGVIVYDDRNFARAPAFIGHVLLNFEDVLSVGGMLESSRFGSNTNIGTPPTTITRPFLVARFGSYPGLIGITASGALLGILALMLEGPTY